MNWYQQLNPDQILNMIRISGKITLGATLTIWLVVFSFVVRSAECSKNSGQNQKNQQTPAAEDETEFSPETVGVQGMASSGFAYSQSTSKAVPKCLGQDMRQEKIIQVTEFCEEQTGEGKNETEIKGHSLCFTACMWKYMGLIGDDFMFTSDIDAMVIDTFPPIAHAPVIKAVRSCAKATVLPLSRADNCTSYGPVKGCILKAVHNICTGNI